MKNIVLVSLILLPCFAFAHSQQNTSINQIWSQIKGDQKNNERMADVVMQVIERLKKSEQKIEKLELKIKNLENRSK